MPVLILIALGTLLTEDLTCITTGVLISQGKLDFWSGTLACLIGIYAGDLLLFLAGRFLGRRALRWSLFRRLVTEEQLDRASAWLSSKGAAVVLLSRFAPGLRLPTYFAAGILRTNLWRFSLYFLLAAGAWTPLLIGFSAILGEQAAQSASVAGGTVSIAIASTGAVWFALRRGTPMLLRLRFRRRLVGFLGRKVRWEFWPPWAAYLPLIPYLLWLSWKHRSLTLFTLANPGMPSGGFIGESKSQILEHLDRTPDIVPPFALIPGSLDEEGRIRRVDEFLSLHDLPFPVVLKPDVGERGAGVAIVRSRAEMESCLRLAACDTIVQQYVAGPEFGVFYYRYPHERSGHILSITDKRFPEVVGDGQSTLEELILRDERAVFLAATYLRGTLRRADAVPAAGETVRLAELGSHCRGAVFVDGSRLKTPMIETAIDAISRSHPGFFFGRFDIRVASVEEFQDGRGFKVIELNGVTGEATHIYDPAVTLLEAYRSMYRQWRIAFEIGAANRARGLKPAQVIDLVRLVWHRVRKPGGRDGKAPNRQDIHA